MVQEERAPGVLEAVRASPLGVDLKLAALAAAVLHYRRASVCTPFPPAEFFGSPPDRDYAAVRECLESLPSVQQLALPERIGMLTTQQLALAHWLLAHPRRPASSITISSLGALLQQLPGLAGALHEAALNPSLQPQAVLQLAPVGGRGMGAAQQKQHEVLAFHGTHFENVHPILHSGLLNASGTRLERTGAAFGEGVYLSTELSVAFAFCSPAPGWQHSTLGRRLRALLVCGVDPAHARRQEQQRGGKQEVPDRYLVVERVDAITIYFLLLYSDQAAEAQQHPAAAAAAARALPGAAAPHGQPPPRQQGWPPLAWLLLVYVAWLAYMGLQERWPWVRRLLRQRLGLRLP